jgi:hypothetical protein
VRLTAALHSDMTGLLTVATTPEVDGQGMGHVPRHPYPSIPYSVAYSYLLSLCHGRARLNVLRALEATGVCESRKHGLEDSTVIFPSGSLARGEAEQWLRQIGHTDHEAAQPTRRTRT